jgi:hypothetical protein
MVLSAEVSHSKAVLLSLVVVIHFSDSLNICLIIDLEESKFLTRFFSVARIVVVGSISRIGSLNVRDSLHLSDSDKGGMFGSLDGYGSFLWGGSLFGNEISENMVHSSAMR